MNNKSTSFNEIRNIKVNNKLIDFSTPIIMGVLNITPDSFYDGYKYKVKDFWLSRTEEMLKKGADIIDIGAVFEITIKDLVNFIVKFISLKGIVIWDNSKYDGLPREIFLSHFNSGSREGYYIPHGQTKSLAYKP